MPGAFGIGSSTKPPRRSEALLGTKHAGYTGKDQARVRRLPGSYGLNTGGYFWAARSRIGSKYFASSALH